MKKISACRKEELEKLLKQTRDIHERNRLCAILGYDDGSSVAELASVLRLSQPTIYTYLNEFERDEKVKNLPRGGRPPKLDCEQSLDLKRHLASFTYLKVKDICAYVKTAFGVQFSRSRMTAWLHENRFVFKCPKKIPGKLNPERQKEFVSEYERLKSSLGPREEIYFVDAVHPEHQSQAARGWIQKGEEKTLQSTGRQTRLHLAGALCLDGMKVVTREYDTVNADAMINFFQSLEESTSAETIYVIMDNARSNKNKKLEAYLKNSRIKPRYLPPYSPNLNPIERLWKIMRETKLYNRYYESYADFSQIIRGFFSHDVPNKIQTWTSRLNDNFQTIVLNPVRPAIL